MHQLAASPHMSEQRDGRQPCGPVIPDKPATARAAIHLQLQRRLVCPFHCSSLIFPVLMMRANLTRSALISAAN
jgi:hypothetical protein